jgi:uncharacterized protein with HEPN domain|tara:strand:- start:2164 stop:2382 length:219 start_codon:yes stop_codon:yes gene_type:complete
MLFNNPAADRKAKTGSLSNIFCCKKRVKNIGEVIKNISKDVKKNYAEISWKDITGMRDILIHEYFGVDLELR